MIPARSDRIRFVGRLTASFAMAVVLSAGSASAQTQFTFSGQMFGDYSYVFSHPNEALEGDNGFGYRRLYLTTDFRLSERFDGRGRLEANQSSTNDDGRAGLTTMNVIQRSAGFLFILLLAHVNERNRIETPEIAYIELFYFSMYMYITAQTLALAAMFRGVDWKLFQWEDNLILKLSFWPLLLAIWFAFTLARFY